MVEYSQDEIVAQVERITSSPTFASSPRLIQFLRFCVTTSLNGEADQLKESTIGVSVFGRSPDYDPRIDPIVRVHARRLRDRLERFYETEGQGERILVEIRKGGYVPRFERRSYGIESTEAALHVEPVSNMVILAAEPRSRRPLIVWTAWTAAILSLIAVAVVIIHRDSFASTTSPTPAASTAPATDKGVSPLTALPGSKRDPSWSPDGASFVFSWNRGPQDRSHIYTMSAAGGSPTPLTSGASSESRPVWSPDGHYVAFVRQTGNRKYQTVIVELRARTERVIYTQSFESPLPGERPALDWSHDGQWIVTSEARSAEPAHLVLISLVNGHAHQITNPPNASTGDLEARFSPDDRQIAFRRGGVGDIWLVSLNDADPSSAQP